MIPNFKTYLKESIWTNINKRSEGNLDRKEDDIDSMSPKELYDYLISNYEPQRDYSIKDVIFINYDETIITINAYENKNSMMGGIDLRFDFFSEGAWEVIGHNEICATLMADSPKSDLGQVPDWLVKELEEFAVINNSYYQKIYLIYPKDGKKTTNKFLIRILDHILERMDDSVKYYVKLKKK